MNVLIRADSSLRIGTGHVMRCLALADQLRSENARVRFVCRDLPGNIAHIVTARGFAVSFLRYQQAALPPGADVPYTEWQNPEWLTDANATTEFASEDPQVDWLIVDNYTLDARWETKMRATAARIMVIDDLANRPHDCDLLLDQNLNSGLAERYDTLIPSNCRRLLGPRYAVLRPEFRALRQTLAPRDGKIRRVLVFFGGSDPGNETAKALLALERLAQHNLEIDVVAGAANPNSETLAALCEPASRIRLHRNSPDMARLMADADLAIGATGGTAWERCCLGLPTILISLAMNQESAARTLADGGYAIYLGKSGAVTAAIIETAVGHLLEHPEQARAFAVASAGLVDGRGAIRVARALDAARITLKPAQLDHCEQILEWRNAEETRRHSHDPEIIPRERHRAWFEQVLRDPVRVLLIAERDGRPLGILRYDCEGSSCVVSVYLVPGQHGHGQGPRILLEGHAWLRANRPDVKTVRAAVLAGNRASSDAFVEAGYRCQDGVYMKYFN